MEIKWYGVYRWYGQDCIFDLPRDLLNKQGVYLWTIPFEGRYLTYYVGETHRFAQRFNGHLRDYQSGVYRVYDPQRFAQGDAKTPIWGGTWKRDRRDPKYKLEFTRDYEKWSMIIHDFLGHMRIFLAPFETDEHTRMRLEASVVAHLQAQGKLMMEQDSIADTLKTGARCSNESPISITMVCAEPILGFPKSLVI